MRNDYRLEIAIASILEDFADLQIRIGLPEGTPTIAAREDGRMIVSSPAIATENSSVSFGMGGKEKVRFKSNWQR